MATLASATQHFEFVIRRTFWFPMMKMILWNMFSYGLNMGIVFGGNFMGVPLSEARLHLFFHMFGLIGTIWILLHWYCMKYTITEKKIVVERGILNIDRDTFLFRNIECVKLHKSLIGRICWFGTIEMYAPTLQEHVFLRHVSQAQKFFKLIQRNIAEHRRSSNIIYPSTSQQKATRRDRDRMLAT